MPFVGHGEGEGGGGVHVTYICLINLHHLAEACLVTVVTRKPPTTWRYCVHYLKQSTRYVVATARYTRKAILFLARCHPF